MSTTTLDHTDNTDRTHTTEITGTAETTVIADGPSDTAHTNLGEETAAGTSGAGAAAPIGSAPTDAPTAAPTPAPAAADNTRAFTITSFVLGIASIVSGWTFIAPIIGLTFGIIALRRKTAERTLALWGVWLNAAMLALTILAAVVVMTFFGFAVITGALV